MSEYTIKEYKEWLLSQTDDAYELKNDEEKNRTRFLTQYAEGVASLHEDLGIVELTITTLADSQTMFYLHFEPNSPEHAEGLFKEMKETLLTQNEKHGVRVLLTCSCGLTTGFFAEQLQAAAEALSLDYKFDAVSFTTIYEKAFDYDVILLAPQIQYEHKKLASVLNDKIILDIPAAAFAQYKPAVVIDMISDALKEKKNNVPEEKPAADLNIGMVSDNDQVILSVGMLEDHDSVRVSYRIYDHGKVTLDDQVIKKTVSEEDLNDLLSYVLKKHEEVEMIGIAMPGIAYHGQVYSALYGFDHVDLADNLRRKYGKQIVIMNDINALALGYYSMHDDTRDLVFYYLPRGNADGGSGIVMNGKIQMGYMNMAGDHIGELTGRFVDDAAKKCETPEGCVEIIATALYAYLCTIAPERLVVYSELLADIDDVREELKKLLPEEYIPDMVRVLSLKEYMLNGIMMRCMRALQSKDWLEVNKK